MHGSNNAEFMGVLVDRQYAPGQKYVQFVFETTEGIRLSLSRNANLIRSLKPGFTYRVSGPERIVGQKRYIHEPTATLVPVIESPSFFKRYKILIPVVASLVVVLGGVGAFAYTSTSNTVASQPVTHQQKPAEKSATKTTEPAATPVTPQPTPAEATPSSPQPQRAATTIPSAKKKPVTSTTKTTPPIANPVVAPEVTPTVADEPTVPPADIPSDEPGTLPSDPIVP